MLKVKQSLTLDSSYFEFYKFEDIASDQGADPRTDTAYVHNNVNRGFQWDIGFDSENTRISKGISLYEADFGNCLWELKYITRYTWQGEDI